VRYQGKPLTAGTLIFLPLDNQAYPVAIRSDGSYEIASLPRGRIQVSVQVAGPRVPPRPAPKDDAFASEAARIDDAGKMARRQEKAPAGGMQIAAAYGDPAMSGLTFDLTAPVQEYVIDLK
jgi:hypothetical protein